MNCPDDSVLASFVNCDLPEAECESLETHLAECSSCRQRVSELEKSQSLDFVLPSTSVSEVSGASEAVRHMEETLENGEFLRLPQMIGPYLVTERLGQGGMGAVYAAEHQILHRKFAIKFIRPKFLLNSASLERFQKEILAAGKLVHPNVVSATDAGVFEDAPFLVMEFLEGETLTQYIQRKNGSVPVREALSILQQAARGLGFAHAAGLVHCDVKPSNLWRLPDGTVKVLDLGLAQASEELEDLSTHPILGTPNFMAPEQSVPHAKIDARADVYALGCVLFYLLTGLTQNDCVCKGIEFPNLKEAGVSASSRVQKFLNSMTKTVVSKRLDSMESVAREIAELRKPIWKKPALWAGVLCAALGTIGGAVWQAVKTPQNVKENLEEKEEKIEPNVPVVETPKDVHSEVVSTPERTEKPKPAPAKNESSAKAGTSTTEPEKPATEPSKPRFWNLEWWKNVGVKGKEKLKTVKIPYFSKKENSSAKTSSPKLEKEEKKEKPAPKPKTTVKPETSTAPQAAAKPKEEPIPLTDAEIFCRKGDEWMKKESMEPEPDEEFLQKAIENYEKAWKLGNSEATLRLWELCWLGRYTPESPAKLTREIFQLAEKGNLDAIQDVGFELWFGRLGERSPEKAVEWFRKAEASKEETACVHDCLLMLGKACETGEGVEKDLKKALELYRRATLSADAQCALGMAYLNGNGVTKNDYKAVELFRDFADYNVTAAYMMGYCGENRLGGESNMHLTLEYYHRANQIEKSRVSRGFPKTLEPNGLKEFPSELYREAIRRNLHSL